MHPDITRRVQMFAVDFQGIAQGVGGPGTGLAMAFGELLFECLQLLQHPLGGLLAQYLPLSRVHAGLAGTGRCGRKGLCGLATQGPDLLGPDRHVGQGRIGLQGSSLGLLQGRVKAFPNRLQLAARGFKAGRKLQVHAGPGVVLCERKGQIGPGLDIRLQGFAAGMGLLQRLGGKHFNTLRQQHGRLTLHHHLVLQVFNTAHHLRQLVLEPGQGLARERSPRLGGIALPGQGVCNVQAITRQQLFAPGDPLSHQRILLTYAFELVKAVLEDFGGTLVPGRHLAIDLLQRLQCRIAGQPVAQAGGTLARCGRRKGAARQQVQGRKVSRRMAGSHVVTPCWPEHKRRTLANQSPIVPAKRRLPEGRAESALMK